jgi:hypothetical protein
MRRRRPTHRDAARPGHGWQSERRDPVPCLIGVGVDERPHPAFTAVAPIQRLQKEIA